MKPTPILAAALLCATLAGLPVQAAHTKKAPRKVPRAARAGAKPVARKPAPPAVGGDGVFGQAYTVSDGGEYGPISLTLVRAEYSAGRFTIEGRATVVPKSDEKLLILHYRVRNPNPSNLFFTGRPLFQTVDADDGAREDIGDSRREGEREGVSVTLKPGASLNDLVTCAVVPASGPVPRLLLTLGRVGLDEAEVPYPLGVGKNVVKPLGAPYADPADPSGTTARAEIPARMGEAYIAGGYDVALISAGLASGPFGFLSADPGKHFLVATVTVTNRNWEMSYFEDDLACLLTTSEDQKTGGFTPLEAGRDVYFEGKELAPGASLTLRLAFPVSTEASLKTLSIAERLDETGGLSHALVYDLAGLK